MTVYPGEIIAAIRQWARRDQEAGGDERAIMVDGHQSNALHCVHQARATIKGDPTTYRIIVAPADAPIELYGRPIGEAFAQPLGDR